MSSRHLPDPPFRPAVFPHGGPAHRPAEHSSGEHASETRASSAAAPPSASQHQDGAATLEFDCGIARIRLEAWLTDELNLARDRDSRWLFTTGFGVCRVSLSPLEDRTLGSFRLERTHLLATGNPDALEAFREAFTLRFMSAGG